MNSAFFAPGVAANALRQPYLWLTIILTVGISLLPAICTQFLCKTIWPTVGDKVHDEPVKLHSFGILNSGRLEK